MYYAEKIRKYKEYCMSEWGMKHYILVSNSRGTLDPINVEEKVNKLLKSSHSTQAG